MLCEIQIKSWQDTAKYEYMKFFDELIETERRKLRALEAAKMLLKENK